MFCLMKIIITNSVILQAIGIVLEARAQKRKDSLTEYGRLRISEREENEKLIREIELMVLVVE